MYEVCLEILSLSYSFYLYLIYYRYDIIKKTNPNQLQLIFKEGLKKKNWVIIFFPYWYLFFSVLKTCVSPYI